MDTVFNSLFGHPWGIVDYTGAIVLVSVVGGLMVGGIAIVTNHQRGVQRDEMDASLKMEMISRGMSADDIVKVLSTASAWPQEPWQCDEQHGYNWREKARAMRAGTQSSHA